MKKPLGAFLLVTLSLVASACSKGSDTPTTPGDTPAANQSSGLPSVATAADLAFCVQETNRQRQIVGRPALAQSNSLEAFAAQGAQVDTAANAAHRHFQTVSGPAFAENEVLRWPLNLMHTVQGTMQQAIAAFVDEGPSGGHYQNLMGGFSQVGCGVFIDGVLITVVQDFR